MTLEELKRLANEGHPIGPNDTGHDGFSENSCRECRLATQLDALVEEYAALKEVARPQMPADVKHCEGCACTKLLEERQRVAQLEAEVARLTAECDRVFNNRHAECLTIAAVNVKLRDRAIKAEAEVVRLRARRPMMVGPGGTLTYLDDANRARIERLEQALWFHANMAHLAHKHPGEFEMCDIRTPCANTVEMVPPLLRGREGA